MRFFKRLNIKYKCWRSDIKHYTINEDYTVDVYEDIYTLNTKIPLRFRKVFGNFRCSNLGLTKLEGCPIEVSGDFDCSRNKLTTLEGCPEIVTGNFDCSYNNLYDLVCNLKYVYGKFDCLKNQIESLESSPFDVYGDFNCAENPLYDMNGFKVNYHKDFDCFNAPISNIIKYERKDYIEAIRIYKVIKDRTISLKRLRYVNDLFKRGIKSKRALQRHYTLDGLYETYDMYNKYGQWYIKKIEDELPVGALYINDSGYITEWV